MGRKTVIIAAICLLVCVLASIVLFSFFEQRQADRIKEAYYEEVSALHRQKQALEDEYLLIEENEMAKLGCRASISLFVNGADRVIYERLFDIVSNGDRTAPLMTGIICLSMDELPDQDGNMTSLELWELIDAGWTTAIFYESIEDMPDSKRLEDYLAQMTLEFSHRSLGDIDTVVFGKGNYYEEYNQLLNSYGIKYAVQNNGTDFELIEARVETNGTEPLLPGYVDWYYKIANSVYSLVLTNGGMTGFMIEADSFIERIENFISLAKNHLWVRCKDGELIVGSLDDAHKMRRDYFEKLTGIQPMIAEKKAEITEKIAVVDRQIKAIYDKYYGN